MELLGNEYNYIARKKLITIDAIVAEGGAEDVALDDRNGSQSEEGRGNRTTSFFLLFSACWCSVVPVVRFPRGAGLSGPGASLAS